MNYLVFGEPCVDIIHTTNNERLHSYGGILYSVIAMSVLAGPRDTVCPVMNLGADEFDNITGILKKYSNINLEGVKKVDHPTRRVNLYYTNYNSGKTARMENSADTTYTTPFENAAGLIKSADAVLINMISGVDISLDTLKKIRSEFKGFIHMDLHNLVMKTNPDGSREHTHLENWKEWCTNTDTIQMNEFEAGIVAKETKNDYEIAEEILINSGKNMTGMIVTRGKVGVSGFVKKEKSFGNEKFFDIDRIDVNAVENPRYKDSTGCGDVFAASFTLDFSHTHDLSKSLHYATRIASFKSSLSGIDELFKLK
ncbi:MAG: carbohydrate kinase family protein [Ignavibacteria bacterium]|nr:carbohydrate kinase family protein [Ignavibacteria bacterium]